jgi:hypothetical protein
MRTLALLSFTGILGTISGCSKGSGQSATRPAPSVVQAAPPTSAAHNPSPPDALIPEASRALAFINRSFVASDCTLRYGATQSLCSRNGVLSMAGEKLVMAEDYEDHYSDGSVKKSHVTDTVAIADLDVDSLKVTDNDFPGGTDAIFINCKNRSKCTSAIQTSDNKSPEQFSHDRLTVGNFSRKDANDVRSYLKRLLTLQQGESPSAIAHEPTEDEALAYMQAHFAPRLAMDGGIAATHRSLTVEGDDLVESMDLVKYGTRPERLEVRVNLKDLDEPLEVSIDRGVGLMCNSSDERSLTNCFVASTGQSSSNLVIMGVSNRKDFARMLKRLIVIRSGPSGKPRRSKYGVRWWLSPPSERRWSADIILRLAKTAKIGPAISAAYAPSGNTLWSR